MTELLTQLQIEEQMYYGGIKRAERMLTNAEENGQADRNPYSKQIYRTYLFPLRDKIKADLDTKQAGRRKAHAVLLGPLDTDAVAYLACRAALNILMIEDAKYHTVRLLAKEIGKRVHNELVLAQIEEENPELFHTLTRDLQRRLSKDERHRVNMITVTARKNGVDWIEWPLGARDQVGMYLLGLLSEVGMLDISEGGAHKERGKHTYDLGTVMLSEEAAEMIGNIRGYVAITSPTFGPCVEPPRPWVTAFDGGFHSNRLRRDHHCIVRGHRGLRHLYRDNPDMDTMLRAANALQETGWRVNKALLQIVKDASKVFSTAEIVTDTADPKPEPPTFTRSVPREQWTEAQQHEFVKWKRVVTEWYTQRKLLGTKAGRMGQALRAADMFAEYPAIYFVYFADTRGRLYPMTHGLHPQGSDLQKALLEFAEGLPLIDADAVKWFLIQGANKWGFDKGTLEERRQWTLAHHDQIMAFASDPINNNDWRDADKPLQFLAWCLEYSRWTVSPSTFVSRIPISMDGSCNGLQNLSAMLRDEVGGEATNLIPSPTMKDIYGIVASKTSDRLRTGDQSTCTAKWLEHGVNRSVVKRSVMTTPYGVTKQTAQDYVIKDYLALGKITGLDKAEFKPMAKALMDPCWASIGDVVVKGREAMDWLRKSARAILRGIDTADDLPVIWWRSPSGFPAGQVYQAVHVHRINSKLVGEVKIRVLSEKDEADTSKHCTALAPNFVHSLDAAHLHLTTVAAREAGIKSLAMIHDDYGTHAANAQLLYEMIRESFVRMYTENDPVEELHLRYPMIPKPPEKGNLDIEGVRKSEFFFS